MWLTGPETAEQAGSRTAGTTEPDVPFRAFGPPGRLPGGHIRMGLFAREYPIVASTHSLIACPIAYRQGSPGAQPVETALHTNTVRRVFRAPTEPWANTIHDEASRLGILVAGTTGADLL